MSLTWTLAQPTALTGGTTLRGPSLTPSLLCSKERAAEDEEELQRFVGEQMPRIMAKRDLYNAMIKKKVGV